MVVPKDSLPTTSACLMEWCPHTTAEELPNKTTNAPARSDPQQLNELLPNMKWKRKQIMTFTVVYALYQ